METTTTTIEIWDGNNYLKIIRESCNLNTEVFIRVQGKKLVVKDPKVHYYRCIPIGEPVEIPVYADCVVDDEPLPEPEAIPIIPRQVMSEEMQLELKKVWGLA